MELHINQAINSRQTKQLRQLINTRLKHYQQGISAQRAANEDRKFEALLGTLLTKEITSDITDVDLASPCCVFIELAHCLLTQNLNPLARLLTRLAAEWPELDGRIHGAVADVLIRFQSPLFQLLNEDEQCLQPLISVADKAWLQYLSVFLASNIRQHVIPDDADWLSGFQCLNQGLNLEQALEFIEHNADFLERPEVNAAWVLIFCDPSDSAVQQHLQSLEQIEPDTAYSVYGVWGEPWCLARIVEGLASARTNKAAYAQWLFLTAFPLPQNPILEDTANKGSAQAVAATIPTLADADAAQVYLADLNNVPFDDALHHRAQQIRFANALLAQHAQHQEIYALGLMALNKQVTHISTRQGYNAHLNNLATLISLSKTPWWSPSHADQ